MTKSAVAAETLGVGAGTGQERWMACQEHWQLFADTWLVPAALFNPPRRYEEPRK